MTTADASRSYNQPLAVIDPRVQQFLDAFCRWASKRSDIQAVALVGSHARGTATETSDVDLVVVADEPDVYLKDPTWAHVFGAVVSQQVEHYGNVTSLRVRYEHQSEIECGFTDARWARSPLDEGTRKVISGGMKVLFERGSLLATLLSYRHHQP